MGIHTNTQAAGGGRGRAWLPRAISLALAGGVLIDITLQHRREVVASVRFLMVLCGVVVGIVVVLALLMDVKLVSNVSPLRLVARASLWVFAALITDVLGRELVLRAEEHRANAILSALPQTTMCPGGLSTVTNYLRTSGSVCFGGGCSWECSCIGRGVYAVVLYRGVYGRNMDYTSDRSTVLSF